MQGLSMANNQTFPRSTIHDINRWVRSFGFSTKTNFTVYKLEGIKTLTNVKIKWDFLCAAVKFWDTEDHVFWFKITEICPTIEEFLAILGYDSSKKSVLVSCHPKHREILCPFVSTVRSQNTLFETKKIKCAIGKFLKVVFSKELCFYL